MPVVYPSIEQILAIHYQEIKMWGGSHGIRDISLLQSALARPDASFAGEDLYPSIYLKSAVFAHSILANHPFLDGNKRTAIVSMAFLLLLNGLEIKAKKGELVKLALDIATKKLTIEQIAQWIEDHTIRIK